MALDVHTARTPGKAKQKGTRCERWGLIEDRFIDLTIKVL